MNTTPSSVIAMLLSAVAALGGCSESQLQGYLADNSTKPRPLPAPVQDIDVDELPTWAEVKAAIGDEAAHIIDGPLQHSDVPLTSKQTHDVWDNAFSPHISLLTQATCLAKQGYRDDSSRQITDLEWRGGKMGVHGETQVFAIATERNPSGLNRAFDNDQAILLQAFGLGKTNPALKNPVLESMPAPNTTDPEGKSFEYRQALSNCGNYEHRQLHDGGDFYERRVRAEQSVDALQKKRDDAIENNPELIDAIRRFNECQYTAGCDPNKDVPEPVVAGFLSAEKAAAADGENAVNTYFDMRREQRRAEAIYLYWVMQNQPS